MALYRNTTIVEATQWFKNGDHPKDQVGEETLDIGKLCELRPDLLESVNPVDLAGENIPEEAYYQRVEGAIVRYFHHPEIEFGGNGIHQDCGKFWNNHGWIDVPDDGIPVCPGDWIVTGISEYLVVKPDLFMSTYEVVTDISGRNTLRTVIATGQTVIPPMTVTKFNDGGDY